MNIAAAKAFCSRIITQSYPFAASAIQNLATATRPFAQQRRRI